MKRADTALSARNMPLNPTKPLDRTRPKNAEKPADWIWGVDVNVLGVNGKPTYDSDGKLVKRRVPMADATLNGVLQSLYFNPMAVPTALWSSRVWPVFLRNAASTSPSSSANALVLSAKTRM
jgi:hypothetical protein